MANENILFRKGTLKDLENAPKVAGSINFTTDEPAIYLDLDSNTRKRIGDLIIVKTKEELMQKNGEAYNENSLANNALVSTWSTTSLYYVEDDNALLRWDGAKWKQLNPSNDDLIADLNIISTTIAGIQSELDNIYSKTEVNSLLANKANTSDVNAALSNKADKADLNNKVNTSDFNNLSTVVGAIKDDYVTKAEKTTLEESIGNADQKATNAASAASKAQSEVDTLEGKVTTLEGNLTNLGTNVATVYETKQDANSKKTELEGKITALQNGAVKDNADAISAESSRAKLVEANLTADIVELDTKITNLSTNTTNNIDNLKTQLIGNKDTDTKDSNTIYGAKAYADNAIDEALVAANAMTFKGVLGHGEGGPWAELPTDATEVNAGDTYKVGVLGQYAGYNCYVGDLLIAKEDGKSEYYHISSGYEDDYNTRLGVDVTNNKIKLNSPVSGELGSVTFQTDENSSLSVSVSGEEDTSFKADSTVTLSLVWGSFGTEA